MEANGVRREHRHQGGIDPARDLAAVVLTHFHHDHTGGLDHFPHTRIIGPRANVEQARAERALLGIFADDERLELLVAHEPALDHEAPELEVLLGALDLGEARLGLVRDPGEGAVGELAGLRREAREERLHPGRRVAIADIAPVPYSHDQTRNARAMAALAENYVGLPF